jgi:thymidylate kinase
MKVQTMIVELFGPPAVGKTTVAHALAAALRKNGCDVRLIVSSRPAERTPTEPGRTIGFARCRTAIAAPLSRAAKLISAISALLPASRGGDTGALLLDLLPPRNLLWSVRYRRYLSGLCHSWRMAREFDGVVIIDQGFATALCSLALLTPSADRHMVARGLDLIPKPDLLIRLDAPKEVLEARLRKRLARQGLFERLFEFDLETSLRQIEVTDELTKMLQEQGRPVTHVNCLDLLESRVDRIMHEIKTNLRHEVYEAPSRPEWERIADRPRTDAPTHLFKSGKAHA